MSSEDEIKKMKIPIFKGDRKDFPVFKARFNQWELATKLYYVTWDGDKTDSLISPTEAIRKKKWVEDEDEEDKWEEVSITEEDEKLFIDNHRVTNKLMECMSNELVEMADHKGGPKRSAYLIKTWLDGQFGYVRAEDSLQELKKKLKELEPSDYEEAMGFLSKFEEINYRMEALDKKYKMNDLQMILEILDKLPDVSDKKPQEKWSNFQAKYRENDALKKTSWNDFSDHLMREWRQIGAPGGGKKEGKALNVRSNAPGGKFFPGKCNKCHQKGHKAADCPKGGSSEKKSGNSSPKDKECFHCHKKGHLITDCPKKNGKVEAAIVLAIKAGEEESEYCQEVAVSDEFKGSWEMVSDLEVLDDSNSEDDEIREALYVYKADSYIVPDSFFDIFSSSGEEDEDSYEVPQWWIPEGEEEESFGVESISSVKSVVSSLKEHEETSDGDEESIPDLVDRPDWYESSDDEGEEEDEEAENETEEEVDIDHEELQRLLETPVVVMAVSKEDRTKAKDGNKYLLLDLGSMVNISTSEEGMHDLKSCRKPIVAANKEANYATQVGTRKFRQAGGKVVFGMTETCWITSQSLILPLARGYHSSKSQLSSYQLSPLLFTITISEPFYNW